MFKNPVTLKKYTKLEDDTSPTPKKKQVFKFKAFKLEPTKSEVRPITPDVRAALAKVVSGQEAEPPKPSGLTASFLPQPSPQPYLSATSIRSEEDFYSVINGDSSSDEEAAPPPPPMRPDFNARWSSGTLTQALDDARRSMDVQEAIEHYEQISCRARSSPVITEALIDLQPEPIYTEILK